MCLQHTSGTVFFCVCTGSIAGHSVALCCKAVTASWKQLKQMIRSQRYSARGACWPNVEQGRSQCDRRGKWHLSVHDLACMSPIIEAECHPLPLCPCEMPVPTQLGYGAKDEPELLILLPSYAKYWDCTRLPPHLD